jgi:isopentenyldiphosphate isomerase
MSEPEEYIDVLTTEVKYTGKAVSRKEIYEKALPHFITHTMLVKSDGSFIFQRRSMHKSYMPGRLVTAGSGHVQAGESVWQASKRELAEEAGENYAKLFAQQVVDEQIKILRYQDPERADFIKFLAVSEVTADQMPSSQDDNDVAGFELYSRKELLAMADPETEFHPESLFILREVYKLKF